MNEFNRIFQQKEQEHLIPSELGQLQVLTQQPDPTRAEYLAICCHPHPLFDGTMRNKVVTTMAKACHNLGIATLRFNFRGVEKSDGEYGDAIGEINDLTSMVDWIRSLGFSGKLILMGFSFGSYIAAQYANEHPPAYLLSVAPPVSRFAFPTMQTLNCPWLVIQGEADEVVAAQDVYDWVDTLPIQPTLIKMPDISHFFHRRLIDLREAIESDLIKQLQLKTL